MLRTLPFAEVELIPPGENDPAIKPIGNIFHVAVSEATDLHDFFEHDGGIEATGYILRDGRVKQYRDFFHQADAQAGGNSFEYNGEYCGYLSWETQGMGEGEWTDAQLATIKRIITWTAQHLAIPTRPILRVNTPGNSYHCKFALWNPDGHTCPGPDRVRQFNQIIVPWMRGDGQNGDDDMPSVDEIWGTRIKTNDGTGRKKDDTRTASEMLAQTHARAGDARSAARQILKTLDDLSQLVSSNHLTDDDKANLAKQIADEVKAEIKKIDAAAVAEDLEVSVKDEG